MATFVAVRRRIAEYRICLERDVAVGVIEPDVGRDVDRCYRSVDLILAEAELEIEAAGPALERDVEFRDHFVGGCARIAGRMHDATTRRHASPVLRALARQLRASATTLREHLWLRLAQVA